MRRRGGDLIDFPGLSVGDGDGQDVVAGENGRGIVVSGEPGFGVSKIDPPLFAVDVVTEPNTLGWLIDPERETIDVFRPGRPVERMAPDGVLDGEPVLPGFRLGVAEVFGWLELRL